jgi:HlyD family secretion protein
MEDFALSHDNDTVELQKVERSLRHYLTAGVSSLILLFGGLVTWGALASLAGAVIAPGTVVVETSSKRIQHPYGGIVAAIRVDDGDYVKSGQVLVQLDAKQLEAEIGAVNKRLYELGLRRWRLSAERDGRDVLGAVPSALREYLKTWAGRRELIAVQRSLFLSRREIQGSRASQLHSRIDQLGEEVSGLRELESGRRRELDIVRSEVANFRQLHDKQLVSTSRLNVFLRSEAKLVGDIGRVKADIARNGGLIPATRLRLVELKENYRDTALRELEKVEGELSQLQEKRAGIADRLSRVEINAPVSGRVHELAVHTIGGVIKTGDTLLSIVPDSDTLVVDAHVHPVNIDRVRQGMDARIRFTAFNMRTTPELAGKIAVVSADQTAPADNQPPYFKVRVRLASGELSRLKGLDVTPGMPAEVMITSEERTVLNYLIKPISDQLNRAFREE